MHRRLADSPVERALRAGCSAVLCGLAAGGEDGAYRALEILKDEIGRTLALIGCPTAEGLGVEYLEGQGLCRHGERSEAIHGSAAAGVCE